MEKIQYTTISIELGNAPEIKDVLQRIAQYKDKTVVNIINPATNDTVIFSAENLQTMLTEGTSKVHFQAMDTRDYLSLMAQLIQQIASTGEMLRDKLLRHRTADLLVEMSDFLSKLGNIIVMISCFAKQQSHLGLEQNMDKLRQCQEHLGLACFYFEDNVRCRDEISYIILPVVQQVAGQIKGNGTLKNCK